VVVGVLVKHIASQFEFIVVKELLVEANCLVAHSIVGERASRPRKVGFYRRPELGTGRYSGKNYDAIECSNQKFG
jgi:hypothetical protein